MKYLTPTVRRYIYGAALALLPVLVFYGLVDVKAAPLWAAFVLALANVKDE
jgi:hypothetical protein